MNSFIGRHPIWSLAIVIAVAVLLFLIFAVWPPELEQMLGRKRMFLSALLNGITLGGLYFLVASGFTLIFGLMRNVNLAHGSLYLFGGYFGYEIAVASGSWILTLLVVFIVVALLGIVLQFTIFRWMEGQDLRQTLVTIALSLILADLMLWRWGGDFYQVPMPAWLGGPVEVPLVTAMRSSGELVYLSYPLVRLVILLGAIVIGVLMWLALNRTKIGILIRAGVDDRDMLSATGVRVQLIFLAGVRVRRGARGLHRRHRRHVPVAAAGRGHQDPACLAGRRDRRRHGIDPGRRGRRGADRPRRPVRRRLHADLRGRAHLRHHGGRAGRAAAGPVGALNHGAGRNSARTPRPHRRRAGA